MGLLEDLGIGFASLLGLKEKSIKENGGKIITQNPHKSNEKRTSHITLTA